MIYHNFFYKLNIFWSTFTLSDSDWCCVLLLLLYFVVVVAVLFVFLLVVFLFFIILLVMKIRKNLSSALEIIAAFSCILCLRYCWERSCLQTRGRLRCQIEYLSSRAATKNWRLNHQNPIWCRLQCPRL